MVFTVLVVTAPAVAQDKPPQQYIRQIAELKQKVAQLNQQIAELNAELAAKPKPDTLDVQAKCSERAFKDFDDWGYKVRENADFIGYYNAALDRCFIQTQTSRTTTKGIFAFKELFDAYSGKQYGQYAWESKEGKKYWEVPPFVCSVTVPSGEVKYCNSEDDFLNLAAVYMGR
jgi:hypothetical protein